MAKTIILSLLQFLVTKLPDTWKIIIGVFILMCIGLFTLRNLSIQESRAYSNSLQDTNTAKFESMVKYNDAQFQLLRDDINSIRNQNNEIIKILIKNQ